MGIFEGTQVFWFRGIGRAYLCRLNRQICLSQSTTSKKFLICDIPGESACQLRCSGDAVSEVPGESRAVGRSARLATEGRNLQEGDASGRMSGLCFFGSDRAIAIILNLERVSRESCYDAGR